MLDFPSAPIEGEVYEGYVFSNGVWTLETVPGGGGSTGVQGVSRVVHRALATGVWTIDPKSLFWDIYILGGGGAGGGASITAAGQASAGAGGNSGGFYRATVNKSSYPDIPTFNVTVGTGGVGAAGANGGLGGNSSISGISQASANGGVGGIKGNAITPPGFTQNTATVSGGSGARGGYSLRGQPGIVLSALVARGGDGGFGNRFGAGMGGLNAVGGNGQAASGAGGGGASSIENTAAAVAGGNGGTGMIHIYEYCEA